VQQTTPLPIKQGSRTPEEFHAAVLAVVSQREAELQSILMSPPSEEDILHRYTVFRMELPKICEKLGLVASELSFIDYSWLVSLWQQQIERESKSFNRL
jgi:hypothetical protein